ncbi:hypothetical protein [Rhizobium etli]|uniref:hypothetical protein n=1 Tax=Rhizobium etli TaxID=29449 RepID=UPI0018AD44F6|nr:hypothetical protein [Rhizobium etli]
MAADTNVMRPAITFDKISIRCRSRSLIAINPIRNLPGHQNPGRVTFLLAGSGHFNFAATVECHSYLKIKQSNKIINATPSYRLVLTLQANIFG